MSTDPIDNWLAQSPSDRIQHSLNDLTEMQSSALVAERVAKFILLSAFVGVVAAVAVVAIIGVM